MCMVNDHRQDRAEAGRNRFAVNQVSGVQKQTKRTSEARRSHNAYGETIDEHRGVRFLIVDFFWSHKGVAVQKKNQSIRPLLADGWGFKPGPSCRIWG